MKVISGGQTGVDQTALRVARAFNLPTGGTAPKGWRTEDGPAPWLGTLFGLTESYDRGYVVRTIKNVRDADMTVWFGQPSPGRTCTFKAAMHQLMDRPHGYGWLENPTAEELRHVLTFKRVAVLNVAGNRLHTHPEASERAHVVLADVFTALRFEALRARP